MKGVGLFILTWIGKSILLPISYVAIDYWRLKRKERLESRK